jgi:tetratricopeptide (TPR) repeat protein
LTSQNLDQAAKRAEFDKLMTAATVHRRRGDYAQATESVRQALVILPDNLDAREFAADMILAHGDVQKASEHYKAILEAEPGRASVEAKYAKAILELAEGDRQRGLVQEMLENPSKRPSLPPRSSTIAALLSIAPGFGHVYSGQYATGGALFVGWVLAWMLFLFTLDSSTGVSVVNRITGPSAAFACLACAIHIYAIVSSAREADRTTRGRDPSEPE